MSWIFAILMALFGAQAAPTVTQPTPTPQGAVAAVSAPTVAPTPAPTPIATATPTPIATPSPTLPPMPTEMPLPATPPVVVQKTVNDPDCDTANIVMQGGYPYCSKPDSPNRIAACVLLNSDGTWTLEGEAPYPSELCATGALINVDPDMEQFGAEPKS